MEEYEALIKIMCFAQIDHSILFTNGCELMMIKKKESEELNTHTGAFKINFERNDV